MTTGASKKSNKFRWLESYAYNGDSSTPRAVMMVLFHHADADTLLCYPTVERLAQACGLSERQVRRQIEANERSGWLKTTRNASSTRKSAPMNAEYQLTFGQSRTNMSTDRSVNESEAGADGQICHEDDPFSDRYVQTSGQICPPNRSPLIDQRLIDQPLDLVDTSVFEGQICPPADSALGGALSEDHGSASVEIDQRSARTDMSGLFDGDPFAPAPDHVAKPTEPLPEPADPIDLLVAALQGGPRTPFGLSYETGIRDWDIEKLVKGSDLFVAKPPYTDDPFDFGGDNRT
ncbi:helix-turn-helix domain-containing protein, partial [Mycobacteroides abscessus]